MVIVLAIGLSLLAWLFIWLKRRHDRKLDKVTGGFNTGITEQSAGAGAAGPLGGVLAEKNGSGTVGTTPSIVERGGSGRNSPAQRSREAFMPYGYGYTNSESRVGVNERPTSPLAGSVMSSSSHQPEMGGMGPWPVNAEGAPPSRNGGGVSRGG